MSDVGRDRDLSWMERKIDRATFRSSGGFQRSFSAWQGNDTARIGPEPTLSGALRVALVSGQPVPGLGHSHEMPGSGVGRARSSA